MDIKSFDNTKIYYKIKRNSNPLLVFIHGWTNNWTTWKKEINHFQKKGYSTLALDLRGHGLSGRPRELEKYHMECFAKDINLILKKEGIKNFILIGHSMGGMIALTYYKLFKKKPKALILAGTSYKSVLDKKRLHKISPLLKHVIKFVAKHKKIKDKHFKHMKEIDFNNYKGNNSVLFHMSFHNTPMRSVFACLEAMSDYNVSNLLPKIKVPTLIIEGDNDKISPLVDSIKMYEQIKNAKIDFIPNGKHFVNVDTPKLVNRYIEHFLKANNLTITNINCKEPTRNKSKGTFENYFDKFKNQIRKIKINILK